MDKKEVLEYMSTRLLNPLISLGMIEQQMDLLLKLVVNLYNKQTNLTADEQTLLNYANKFLNVTSVVLTDLTNTNETGKLDNAISGKTLTRTQQKLYYDWCKANGL